MMTQMLTRFALSATLGLTATFVSADPARYDAPDAALEALVTALRTGDQAALVTIFGEEARDLLSTGNPDRDAQNRVSLLALAGQGYRTIQNPDDPDVLEVAFGNEDWPFPIPLSESDGTWAFDIDRGRDEVLFRRIGLNELNAIEIMHTYVDIQAEYRLVDYDEDGVMEFAASLLSTDGLKDGLFWGEPDSPFGDRIALASLDGYFDGEVDQDPEPFGGYYYRVLTSQTDAAPGGAMDYMMGGNMIGGHALLAVPADYGDSGVHTFMVAENGRVLEADLGPESLDIAHEMRAYDPDARWQVVQE